MRLAERPAVGETVEVVESPPAGVLELRAGARARVVEPPGARLQPEHRAPTLWRRGETLLGDLTPSGGRGEELRPRVDGSRCGTASLVLPVRTVRVPVAADTGGQEDPPGAPQTPEVT